MTPAGILQQQASPTAAAAVKPAAAAAAVVAAAAASSSRQRHKVPAADVCGASGGDDAQHLPNNKYKLTGVTAVQVLLVVFEFTNH
jgi:hypothetical protein